MTFAEYEERLKADPEYNPFMDSNLTHEEASALVDAMLDKQSSEFYEEVPHARSVLDWVNSDIPRIKNNFDDNKKAEFINWLKSGLNDHDINELPDWPWKDFLDLWNLYEDKTPVEFMFDEEESDTPIEFIRNEEVSDVNGDGDTDVVAADTDNNGKKDAAVVTADSKEEAKDGLKEAIDTVKEDADTPDVDSTGTAEIDEEEKDDSDSDSKDNKRSKRALNDYIASDKKEKDVEGTCSDASLKNIMSSLLNYRY